MSRLVVASLALACLAAGARASCQGNGCREQAQAARASGLLGTTLGSCTPKDYPQGGGSLSPITIDRRINNLKWAEGLNGTVNDKYIFAMTMDVDGFPGGPLYRSDSGGQPNSWADATPKLAAALPQGNMTLTGVMDVLWHKDKPERLFIHGKGRFHFVSSDYGGSFSAVAGPGGTEGYGQELRLHPRQTDWILAKVRRNECLVDRRSTSCGFDLFLTQDFGGSWTNLTANSAGRISSFRDYDWGCRMDMYAGKPTPDEAIFATMYASADSQKGLYPGWDSDLHYAVSLDFFKSPVVKMVPCGNLFEIVAKKVYLAVPSDCPVGPDSKPRKLPKTGVSGRSVTMYVSDADGDEFTEVCLPVNLEDDGYNMIHTHDDKSAFILADHAEPGSSGPQSDSPTSDAYAPGYTTAFYTLSLRSVYRRDFITDFSRVEGVPGMYIANQVDEAGKGFSRSSPTDFLQTKISLNGGADWQSLPPPASFRFGTCNTCQPGAPPEQCRLHLHGPTSWFAPEGPRPNFYSHEGAPGLVIATGNVGPHLDFRNGGCTFVSRDAGLTWEDVADYVAAIYEFGNSGGLIAMAPHKLEGPTEAIYVSPDHGGCWHKVALPEAMSVENIRVDPLASGHVFLVHGQACVKTQARQQCSFTGGGTPPAKMFMIDVKDLMQADWRDCNTEAGSADYEQWQVPKPDTCLLGARYDLLRRKRDTGCFNPASYTVNLTRRETCNCTLADTECEYGYQRSGSTCTKMADLSASACSAMQNSGYAMSTTYRRLVHADQCAAVGGVIPDTDGKGNAHGGGGGGGGGGSGGGGSSGSSGIKKFFLFMLVTGILVTVGGVVWANCLPPALKEAVKDRLAPVLGTLAVLAELVLDKVIAAWDWARAKFSGATQRNAAEAAFFEPLAEVDPEVHDHRSPPLFPGR
ncbi:Vacuolar protein sorting/targeting protein 10 [Chlorella vulgaris]